MDCGDIIARYLYRKGYDGVYSEYGECACNFEDFAPCGESCRECIPGYERPAEEGSEFDYIISSEKPNWFWLLVKRMGRLFFNAPLK